jgi:arginine repressor
MVLADGSTAGNADDKIKTRLMRFLVKDKKGIRKCLLRLFLQTKSYTTSEIYESLVKQGFDVSYRGIYAMVGQMHSRLGILRIYPTREHRIYSLKENCGNIVEMVLSTG